MPELSNPMETAGIGKDQANDLIREAMSRISKHDPARLNAVAHAVTDVRGFTPLSVRYSIAVLTLEALEELANGETR